MILAALALLPRCAGLYNQARLDAAKEAQTAFVDAKLGESLVQERAQSDALHTRELSVVERQSIAIRDAELIELIEQSPANLALKLRGLIEKRLQELGGNVEKARSTGSKLDAIAKQEVFLEELADVYRLTKIADDPAIRCPKDAEDQAKIKEMVSAGASPSWQEYVTRCEPLAKLKTELAALDPEGEFESVLSDLRTFETERAAVKQKVELAVADFRKKKKELDAERKENKSIDLTKTAESFKKQLEAINVPDADKLTVPGLGRLRIEADLKWLETQQTHVANLLAASAKSKNSIEVPAGVDDDLQIATVLPGIAAQLNAGLKYPRVSALLLQSEHLRLESERVRNELAGTDAHLRLLRARRTMMALETEFLGDAFIKLENKENCSENDLKVETFAKLPDKCRNTLTAALIKYSTAWTLGRIPATKVDWALIHLRHDRSLDQSASALAQWQNLIGVPLAGLVTSYETGVKADDIGRTLNAAGLGWIGMGVH